MRILSINGSYRAGGITDQALAAMRGALTDAGHEVIEIALRDEHIGFCRNCRECARQPGAAPGRCVQDDAMTRLVDEIERADGYIIASPTNCGAVTAVFKRFMERLLVYAYWPWGQPAPRPRRPGGRKPALLVSSSAAPGIMGRWLFGTTGQLRQTARTIGGRVRGVCFTGLAAKAPDARLTSRQRRRAERLAHRLPAAAG